MREPSPTAPRARSQDDLASGCGARVLGGVA